MSGSVDRIAITGGAGYLGRVVARRCVDAGAGLLGIDVRPKPPDWPSAAAFERFDITDGDEIRRALDAFQPRVLVHLAWIFDPIHDTEHERRVDVVGTKKVFAAASAAGVGRIVYPSSTTSYGIDPQRRDPLTEDDPPVANPRYPYARFKAEIEQWLPEFRRAHPKVEVVVPRACIVLGRDAGNIVTHITEWPVMFRVGRHDPPLQFLHEDDAAELIWWCLRDAPAGTFNAAGHGVVRYREICRMAGRPCIALPAWLLYPLVGAGWRLRLLRFPAGLLDYIRYPWVADTRRLTDELGFVPRFSTRDALAAYLDPDQR